MKSLLGSVISLTALAIVASVVTPSLARPDSGLPMAIAKPVHLALNSGEGELPAIPQPFIPVSQPVFPSTPIKVGMPTAAQAPGWGLEQVVTGFVAEQTSGATELLQSGMPLEMTAPISSGPSVLDQHSVNVHVSYDAQPIGGILSVRVELVPTFAGIGAATRPVLTRNLVEAVDNFDDEFIAQAITRLTKELSNQFAAMGPGSMQDHAADMHSRECPMMK